MTSFHLHTKLTASSIFTVGYRAPFFESHQNDWRLCSWWRTVLRVLYVIISPSLSFLSSHLRLIEHAEHFDAIDGQTRLDSVFFSKKNRFSFMKTESDRFPYSIACCSLGRNSNVVLCTSRMRRSTHARLRLMVKPVMSNLFHAQNAHLFPFKTTDACLPLSDRS